MPRLTSQYAATAAVALSFVALAAAGGGYSLKLIAVAGIGIWWTVMAAIAFLGLPRGPVPRAAVATGLALAGLALLSGLSIAWASDNGRAFAEMVRVASYLGLFVLVVIVSDATGRESWLLGLAIGLVVVAALALGSRLEAQLFPAQDLASFLPSVRARLSYPLNYWNGLAACMATAIVLLGWLGGTARSAAGRALAAALLPVPALALYLTSSRGGVLAAAAGVITLLAVGASRLRMIAALALGGAGGALLIAFTHARADLVDGLDTSAAARQGDQVLIAALLVVVVVGTVRLAIDRPLDRIRVPRATAAVAWLAVALAFAVTAIAANPASRLDEFNDPPAAVTERDFVSSHLTSSASSGRYQLWQSALDAFTAHSVRGVGAGGYESWWTQHGSLAYYVRDAHSLFLQMLGELGVAGLALIVAFVAIPFAAGVRSRGHPASSAALAVLAAGSVSAAIDWTWQLPAAIVPLVVAAALLAGRRPDRGAPGGTLRGAISERHRFGLGIAVLGVGWLAVVAAAILLGSTALVDRSQRQVRDGDLAAAAGSAREAESIEPWAAAPRLQLALVEELRGDLAAARRAAAAAADRSPDDWRIWLVTARLRTRAGDVDGARRALERVRTLNPRSPLFAGA